MVCGAALTAIISIVDAAAATLKTVGSCVTETIFVAMLSRKVDAVWAHHNAGTVTYQSVLLILSSSAGGTGWGRGCRPLRAGHPDGHMGRVIGRDVDHDVRGCRLAGGQWGAGWVGRICRCCWCTHKHEQ